MFTLFDIVRDVRPEQLPKAFEPMLVTLFGIERDVRPEHLLKAEIPMLVTQLGIVRDVRLEQPAYLQTALFQLFTC